MSSAPVPAVLPPLHYKLFRAVWTATLVANISVWMQNVAAAWLMTSLTTSPLMVALIQTAISLPAFLFGLPGGVLADHLEKRRLLILTHGWMLVISCVVFALLQLGGISPLNLLVLTFLLGIGSALSVPAWQASTSDAVPREALMPAINLNAIAYNAARAVGPGLAGLVIAGFGIKAVFAINIVMFILVLNIFIFWYRPKVSPPPAPESLFSALRGGLRYVRHAKALHGHIVRTLSFVSCASGLWALLPLIAKNSSASGAEGYGLLLGSLGVGAVGGGLLLARIRSAAGNLQNLIHISVLVFSAAMLIAAWLPTLYIVSPALVIAGAAWISFNSTISGAFQTTLPAWVRARALAIYMLSFQGSMALGGAIWGAIASHLNVTYTISLAALLMAFGLLLNLRRPVRMGNDSEVTPSAHWAEPTVVGELAPEDGPVAVQIDYHVPANGHESFLRELHALGRVRRRDGASYWQVYRDLSNAEHYNERFIVPSWGEYQRQRGRATLADRELEQNLRQFLKAGTEPLMSHFIAAPYPKADH